MPPQAALAFAAAVVGLWLGVFHGLGVQTWHHGVATFARIVGLALLFPALPSIARGVYRVAARWLPLRERPAPAVPVATPARARRLVAARFVAITGVCWMVYSLALHGLWLRAELRRPDAANAAIDIAVNTYTAATLWFAGTNPYAARAQVAHDIEPGPGVAFDGDEVRLHGLPYSYGYPYFPVMMLGYVPFRRLAPGYSAMRVANACFVLLALAGVLVLTRRLAPARVGAAAAPWAGVAYLHILALRRELYNDTVTDVIIAVLAIAAFVALERRAFVATGVLLGLAQGCKLLPGPLLVIPVLAWLGADRRALRVLLAYVATSVVVIAPFAARDPARFVSSTVMFYLTFHRAGDDTAAYFYLPAWARAVWLWVGPALALAVALAPWRARDRDALAPLQSAFLSYFVFIAFGRMSHLNYIWAIYPLGASALVLTALRAWDDAADANPVAALTAAGPPPR